MLDKEYSWNSLYVYFENKCNKTEEIPFVDSLRIRLKSPQKLEITVVEKGILGYLYVPSLGKNAYFDKDGFVVETFFRSDSGSDQDQWSVGSDSRII